jgi:hypothetical protein
MINNFEEHEKKMAEWCNKYNKEELNKARQRVDELKKENEELKAKLGGNSGLKAPVPSYKALGQLECCRCCQPIKDDPYKNAFDILGYAVLIRLCVDILEEARKYRPDITIDDVINGVNEGKIKLSLYGYDILSPDSGEKPKVEFVD